MKIGEVTRHYEGPASTLECPLFQHETWR